MRRMIERQMDVELFGKRLRTLRGQRSLAEVARATGVPDHTLSRYEKGEIDKPAFADVILLGKEYGLGPEVMAALADLIPIEAQDEENFPPHVRNVLTKIRVYFSAANQREQQRMADILSAQIDMADFNAAMLPSTEVEVLPEWLQQIRGHPAALEDGDTADERDPDLAESA